MFDGAVLGLLDVLVCTFCQLVETLTHPIASQDFDLANDVRVRFADLLGDITSFEFGNAGLIFPLLFLGLRRLELFLWIMAVVVRMDEGCCGLKLLRAKEQLLQRLLSVGSDMDLFRDVLGVSPISTAGSVEVDLVSCVGNFFALCIASFTDPEESLRLENRAALTCCWTCGDFLIPNSSWTAFLKRRSLKQYRIGLAKELNCTSICPIRRAVFVRNTGKKFPKNRTKTNNGMKEKIMAAVRKAVVLATLDSSFAFIKTLTWLIWVCLRFRTPRNTMM